MITYVNSAEAKLFELAKQDLLDRGIEVGEGFDLNEYLNRLAQLKEISPKYVRLPLYEDGHRDEEIFEINANERTIKVPTTFSRNGVGVVSDELAETIWFRINRYFDIKDFGKAAGTVGNRLDDGDLHILIQWEAPDKAQGASWAYAIDADTDPEYIYFGWALTADHLTKQAGNIKFGIRILQYDADGIAYSFATQAAQIAVKPGLNFDLTDEGVLFEDVEDKMSSRLMGGQIAHCPVFSEDLQTYILNLEPENPGDTPSALLEVTAAAPVSRVEDPEHPGEFIEVQEEYDAIAYKWYKKGAHDNDFSLIDPDDAEFQGQFTPALTVTSSGAYYVVVFGMKEIVDSLENIYENGEVIADSKFKYHASVASSKSKVCRIPAPIKLDIKTDVAKSLVLGNEAALLLVISRQNIEEDIVGNVSLKFEKTASAAKMTDAELAEAEFIEVDMSSEPGTEDVLYTQEDWDDYLAEHDNEEPDWAIGDIKIAGEPGTPAPITYTIDEHIETNEDDEIIATSNIVINMVNAAEGYYRITVINSLNGNQEETISEVICRVVRPAAIDSAVASLLTQGGAPSDAEEGSVTRGNKIKANVTISGLSDELEILWYRIVDEQDPHPDDISENDILIEGADGDIYAPDDDGSFYFAAINKVDESEVLVRSNVIVFRA